MRPRVPKVSVYYRKNRGSWHVRWREHGQSRESRGYPDEAEAEDAAHRIREQLRRQLPGIRSPDRIGTLIGEWWDTYATKELEAATRYAYKSRVEHILHDFAHTPLYDLSTPDISRWHRSLKVSPTKANGLLTVLSSILQLGVENHYLPVNPARGVKRLPENRHPVTIPTQAEIARLGMTAPSDHARGMLLVAAYAGPRLGELRFLQKQHHRQGRLLIEGAIGADGRPKHTKTNRHRWVPLPPGVDEWLTAYTEDMASTDRLFGGPMGGPLNKSRWRTKVWLPWQEQAGTSILWRHLRHYYASQLAAIGASILQCKTWMGHSSITTTMDLYAFLFDADEPGVMRRLDQR